MWDSSGTIGDFTQVTNSQIIKRQGPEATGITYSRISRNQVFFSPEVEDFYERRRGKPITTLSGTNNCGKTYLLKQLFSFVGPGGYLMSCNRFSHVDVLNTRNFDAQEEFRFYDNFMHNFYTSQQNTENNEFNLDRIITSLKDNQRDKLFSLCKDLLGNEFCLKRTDPENTFSPFYIDMDGENLRYGGSGTRLLLSLLGTMFIDNFRVVLIDEPEVGLSPKIQSILARIFYEDKIRSEYFPHLKQIYVATHSHLFLDRMVLSNNFIVNKIKDKISIKQVNSIGELHNLQFNMLGNELESVFLPSAIIIVEGESDVSFLAKVARLFVSGRRVAVVRGGGDGEIQKKINFFKEAFGDMASSPYSNRVFVVLDNVHSAKTGRIENQGIQKENIFVWSKNGIEYFYPKEIVARVFNCSLSDIDSINLESQTIEFNGIRKTKKELSNIISEEITQLNSLHPELKNLIDKLLTVCN